jgi:hypothetical protein
VRDSRKRRKVTFFLPYGSSFLFLRFLKAPQTPTTVISKTNTLTINRIHQNFYLTQFSFCSEEDTNFETKRTLNIHAYQKQEIQLKQFHTQTITPSKRRQTRIQLTNHQTKCSKFVSIRSFHYFSRLSALTSLSNRE